VFGWPDPNTGFDQSEHALYTCYFITTCNKSVELNNLVASCQQAVDNLSTSREQAVRTHIVDKLLEQHCYKSAAGLLQLVRFHVCTVYTTFS
jgi:hypothetical protein